MKPRSPTTLIAKNPPGIINTDQGCQFTSAEWTSRLLEHDVRISSDGKGRWMDNVFIERLWRSVKYEEIYLHEHATIPVLEAGLNRWFHRYNTRSPHQALGNLTPQVVCENRPKAPPQPVGTIALIAA
jgi:putative transposase